MDKLAVNKRKALHVLKDAGKITPDAEGIAKGLEILDKLPQPLKGYYYIEDLMR